MVFCLQYALRLVAVLLSLWAISCKKEERVFRVDPPSANTVAKARVGAPILGTLPATMPATRPSPRPVRHNYESNAYAIAEGQRLYSAFNCVGCHAHGGGGIGPALMDDIWIHGSDPEIIFGGIVDGWPNGMPAFAGKIADYQVWQLVAYVRSLSGISDSRDAAPGRDDHMRAVRPANSASPGRARISTVELQDLRRQQNAEFNRVGWLDRSSGEVRIPETIAREVTALSNGKPTTGPASRHASPASQQAAP